MDMRNSSEAEMSDGEPLAADYEVFLSFRGPDTRQGFTDCLYQGMLDANIRVFFDEEELHVGKEIGDELPTAIEKSKIYIPIFSKGYASSAWCLRELAHMVECKISKPSEKEIMPIFYNVKPRDVKLKSRRYMGALEEHEKKFGPQTRGKWEDALKSVAKIRGWELKKEGHGKFIKSVIREILMNLKIKDKYVTEHLVGMEDQVETVVKLLDVNSGGIRFLLVHEMGGIGKTTLAKVVFNKLNSHFSHCCFLGNVRESSLKFGLKTLQKQLLSDMFGSGFRDEINDVEDGIMVIKKRLSDRKLFIVLDDVSDEEQLKKLAINHISFGSGSKVILTTRNKSIIKADQTLEYEVKHLDSGQSLELFSRHAFGKNPLPEDYVGLSRQVVSIIKGLPLALEVIGSLLCRQSKAFWIDVLDNLREMTHDGVLNKLKISYDVLSHEQKQIFLDIACLFVDEDKTNAFYMWKDCKFFPDYSIQVLVCMSLIKITDDNKFWMHDQLRDLGRKIVVGDTRLMDRTKQSRLWDYEMANNIVRTKERKEAIEAVRLYGETYTGKELSELPKIRFLKLLGAQLDGDFENQLSELRYMSWYGCPPKFLAINFHPTNLVVLKLSHAVITEHWAGWSQITVAKKLKVLDLSRCVRMTRTPDFSHYTSLERLILQNCMSLIEVDDSLERLKCLIYFNANGCTSLRELPEGIGQLEKLEYLYLGNCKELRKLPESFGRVTSLVELDLSYTAITRLPDSIGNQKRLSILKLQSIEIDVLPSSIGNLRKLKSLSLLGTNKRELPVSIRNLESLLELDDSGTQCLWLPESVKADKTLEYEVKPLDSIQSLELFSRHAFGRNPPPDDYVDLSRQAVSTTGGLPLALKVIGSLLRRQSKPLWIDVLDNLREIPHQKVQDKLKISYNVLSHEQKQIFLDIACFFVDEDKTNALYMWKDCRFFPDYSIQVLVCMSLIKITNDNKFWIHNQLRDLGRKIVLGDTRLMDRRKQSRLWVYETANNIIRTEERKETIEAICLRGQTYTSKEFSKLPNIRFLKLNWGQLVGHFENQLSELRYMSWYKCPQELFAINFHPTNLVVLKLSCSSITEDWVGWSQMKVAKKLKSFGSHGLLLLDQDYRLLSLYEFREIDP